MLASATIAKFDRIDKPLTGRQLFSAIPYAVIVVWINAYICRELFTTQAAHMNSMHGFWVALAKRGGDSWLHSNWWPFWDCGIPFEFTYAPLIPMLISVWSSMRGITHELALQSITGFVYCLAPLSLFLMAWLMTRAPGCSFLAALIYSLTSPTQLIVPDAEFAWRHFWDARRLYLVAVWDDTPHLTAVALLPTVILFLTLAIRKRRPVYYAILVLLIALMALASNFGPVEVLTAAVCLIAVFPRKDYSRNALLVISIGLAAYAIVAPFLPPSMLVAIRKASANAEGGWTAGSVTALGIVLLGWIVLWQVLARWTADWRLRFFALFAYLTSSVPVIASYLHRQFLPQPGRYKLEMELAIALILVFGVRSLFEKARLSLKAALLFLFLALAGEQIASHRQFAKNILQPADVTQTIEYRTAAWASQNLPGIRVMLSGSIAQWANNFTDVWQFSGSSWSQAYNQAQQRGLASIYNGGDTPQQDARVSLDWLRAFGVGAIAVSGPASQEYWKPFSHPAKFEGLLPVLWREDDVTVYKVPQSTASLVHVLNETAIVGRPPAGPRDTDQIEKYVAALDDPSFPAADFRLAGPNNIQIRTMADPGQAISIQVSYHPGWHAKAGNRAVEVHRDGLGLMWLRPGCSGLCEIQLDYDGGWELRLCRYLSYAALGALLLAGIWRSVSRARFSAGATLRNR
ncbi:MAG TPA: hypothetical protein VNX70_11105 [Bryobacteraceae bacterium]|nr:hypothetical protein [Bryobacteraceae bacterium]